jgi:cysteine desulfurase / selenocysteine lyase
MTIATMPAYDVKALREHEFPWAARGEAIFLNHASTGPHPERTLRALHEYTSLRAQPWKVDLEMQFGTLRRSRELCAALIGASADEIACMVNTTYGLNLAARALPLHAGDTVLTFDREFPANIYPWMALERSKGVRLQRIPFVDGMPDEETLLRELERPDVKAVSISWVQFAAGCRADLARIGRACRERGKWFVVDAIQGVGAAMLDVKTCGIDILACGGQKWLLSPWGSGFVYVREELVHTLEPVAVGWMATRASEDFSRLVDYDLTYFDNARRFEVITLPYQDFYGLNASLSLIHELGLDHVAAHIESLADIIVDWARDHAGVKLVTPAERAKRAGIVGVAPRNPEQAFDRLTKAGVVCSLREGAIRLSPHCYTTKDEVERALELLEP